MRILGIETSTAVCSVGLINEKEIIEYSIVENHIHSEKLLSLIDKILKENKLVLNQIDGIAISIGPGSFTGLRIGLSTAKGLCYSLDKPLIAVPTFDAIANCFFNSNQECRKLLICVDAKQGEYYVGLFENQNGKVSRLKEVEIKDKTYINSLSDNIVCITDCNDKMKQFENLQRIENIHLYCKGDYIALEAINKWELFNKNNWFGIEPFYLKDFKIRKNI